MGDIYTQSEDEITRARQDFNTLPAERKMEILTEKIDEFDWDEQAESSQVIDSNEYPPEVYSESSRPPFSQFRNIEEIEAPLVMPEIPKGESESKGDDGDDGDDGDEPEADPGKGEERIIEPPGEYSLESLRQWIRDNGYPTEFPKELNTYLNGIGTYFSNIRGQLRQDYKLSRRELPPVLQRRPPGAKKKGESRSSSASPVRPSPAPARQSPASAQPAPSARPLPAPPVEPPAEPPVEPPAEPPVGEGRGRRSKGASDRKKIHKSGAIKPETFKKFIKLVMKKFDDSATIRRI